MVDSAVLPPGAVGLRRDAQDRWLCSTAGCRKVATHSASVTCNDCGGYATARTAEAEAKAAALVTAEKAVDAALARHREAPEGERAARAADVEAARAARSPIPSEITRLRLIARDHAAEHTHPVYACDVHWGV